jgi:hypothetical protein
MYNNGKEEKEILSGAELDESGYSDIPVLSSNRSQGNTVEWNEEEETITVTSATGSVTLKEGRDFYIGSDGKPYYMNDASNAVIAHQHSQGNQVELIAGEHAGESQITINGDIENPLLEGRDYYIGGDGKAYYYGTCGL